MENRCQKLARSMPEGFEAALVTTAPNRFYFLDFDADDAGSLLIFPDESVFLIDSRYIEVAEKTVKSAKVVEEHDRLAQIAQLLHRHGVHRLLACLRTSGNQGDRNRHPPRGRRTRPPTRTSAPAGGSPTG